MYLEGTELDELPHAGPDGILLQSISHVAGLALYSLVPPNLTTDLMVGKDRAPLSI